MDVNKLSKLYESDGKTQFTKRICGLINEGKINENNFSLKNLWEAVGRPSFSREKIITESYGSDEEVTEALSSTAFPKITGALINKVIQKAYDLEGGVGMSLVNKIPSSQREETIVGYTDDMNMKEIPEGMEYSEGSIGEKYHKIKNRKFGRIIALTEEMIKFDQTGQMIMRAKRIGEMARYKQEEIIFDAILGNVNTGEYAAWRPNGTATTLYSNTSTDPFTTATLDNLIVDTLTDQTDLTAAMAQFATFTDENGNYMKVRPKVLLVGLSLLAIANEIVNSGQSTTLTAPSGNKNIYTGMQVADSTFVDNVKGASYWYLGDFKKQFIYTEVFPLQTLQAKAGNSDEFKRDTIFQYKARFMGGCGAVTNRYAVQSTGAG